MTRRDRKRFQQIGIDRFLKLAWLQETSRLIVAGDDLEAIKSYLIEYLKTDFPTSSDTIRGSMDKTLTILLRIWVRPPEELKPMHERALLLLNSLPQQGHLAIHWGMTMAVYPFWGAVAANVGRLLSLQGNVAVAHVQRRLREQYGERETVSRSVRRILQSFTDWGVLEDGTEKGLYTTRISQQIDDAQVVAWLVEAYLHSIADGKSEARMSLNAHCFFPFQLQKLSGDQLASFSEGLDIFRQSLDQELIMLRDG